MTASWLSGLLATVIPLAIGAVAMAVYDRRWLIEAWLDGRRSPAPRAEERATRAAHNVRLIRTASLYDQDRAT